MSKANRWMLDVFPAAVLAAGMMCLVGTAVAAPSDYWITTKVKIGLIAGKNVSGWNVNVDTVDGEVTLHGTVTSDNDKAKATEVARAVDGVRNVKNDLRVAPMLASDVKKMQKEERSLIAEVDTALKGDSRLRGNDIRVRSAAGGVVLLMGSARSLDTELYALQVARKVDGVDGVMSEITTPPQSTLEPMPPSAAPDAAGSTDTRGAAEVASDAWITTATKVRLLGDGRTPGTSINVDTESGVVTLFGRVPTAESKAAAEELAHKVDGVKQVVNELQVVPASQEKAVAARDDEIQKAVATALGERPNLKAGSIAAEVKNGVVRLSGSVATPSDWLAALRVARGVPGVKAVENDLKIAT